MRNFYEAINENNQSLIQLKNQEITKLKKENEKLQA